MLPAEGRSCSTHLDTPASASCGRCGRPICNVCIVFDRAGATSCTTCASASPGGGETIPWERRDELGLARAFLQTVGAVLVRPHQVMGPPAGPRGLGSPILFAVLCHTIGMLFAMLWQVLYMVAMVGSLGGGMMGAAELGSLVGFGVLGGPLAALVWVGVWGLIVHVFLLMYGAAGEGLGGTMRVMGYASAAGILNAIPLLGGMIAVIWGIVIQCVGLAYGHRTGAGRTTAAVLTPFLVCCVGGFVLGLVTMITRSPW